MIRIIHLPRPPEFLMRQMAARVRFHYMAEARKAVEEAERKLLAATTPQEKAAAQQELLEAHQALAEARDWEPVKPDISFASDDPPGRPRRPL